MNQALRQSANQYNPANDPGVEFGDLVRHRLLRNADAFADFGEALQCAPHDYHRLNLFQESALIELLDKHPRRRLQCFTMGEDPTRPEQWKAVCIRGISGKELFRAVQHGRLWVNVTNVDEYDHRYLEVVKDMYAQIEAYCPTIEKPELDYTTLVLAGPGTQFYYHINPENNMLWNIRGDLRLSMLPAMDFRFVPQSQVEEIFAREASGSIPYRREFENFARSIAVTDGECAWWPQSAPIRMQYQTFCVSLVTSFYCPMRHRREIVQLANRYLMRSLGLRQRSIAEEGAASAVKRFAFRALRKFFPARKAYDFTDSYVTNLRVNMRKPGYIEKLDQVIIPEFSKYYEMFGSSS